MNDLGIEQEDPKVPKVTVLMAVYNGERYLQEAIESILGQTFTDFEFIIVNDGSTDSSRDIVLSYHDSRIRLIDNPENMGLTKSLNRGLSLARGEYVARLDADDRSHSTRLQKQVTFLDTNRKVAVLGTQLRHIDAKGKVLLSPMVKRAVDPLVFRWHWIFDNPLAHSTTVFRREIVWDILGGYNENFLTNQDFELWSRVGHNHDMCNLPDVLVDFRVHDGSVSKHYTPVNIMKLVTVYEYNIERLLHTENFPRKFPLSWLQVTMPALNPIGNAKQLLQMFNDVQKRFFVLYPTAAKNREIRDHTVSVLTRCARYFATVDRRGSLRFILEMFRLARVPFRELSIYTMLFLFGDNTVKEALGIIKQKF